MPPRRSVQGLQYLCCRQISTRSLDILLDIEKEGVRLQSLQTQSLQLQEVDKLRAEILAVQNKYLQLVSYLGRIPGALIGGIHQTCLVVYTERYQLIHKGLNVWVLTKGSQASEFYNRTLPTNTMHFEITPARSEEIPVPSLSSVLELSVQHQNLTVLDFKRLTWLSGTSESVFTMFNTFLASALPNTPKLKSLTLCSHNSNNSLPQCTNEHLELLGSHCPNLEFLDVSFNKQVTGEGLRGLVPNQEKQTLGCVNLEKLLIFDTGVFEKEVAKVIYSFPHLTYLGYKETGKVLKTLHKGAADAPPSSSLVPCKPLNLTHVDNLGCKTRRLIASALRCKKPVALAISVLCPNVRNVKLRVADDDTPLLGGLQHLEAVELVYHVGSIGSPGPHTQAFLGVRGAGLTSIALICNTMSLVMLDTIAQCCPGLAQLWSRSNHLLAPYEVEGVNMNHNYLSNLHTLYLRVGEGELSVTSIPEYVLPFLVRNAGSGLKELIVAVRSNVINDSYIYNLVCDNELFGLQKILLVVPGLNSLPGILKLKAQTVHNLLHLCPQLGKLGNLLSWDVDKEEAEEIEQTLSGMNYDLQIINKKMTMR